jgi:hypothetical protein
MLKFAVTHASALTHGNIIDSFVHSCNGDVIYGRYETAKIKYDSLQALFALQPCCT